MNRKHYVIYFENDTLIETTPKEWARANPELFSEYNFSNQMPTTDAISAYLVKNLNFTRIENVTRVITIEL